MQDTVWIHVLAAQQEVGAFVLHRLLEVAAAAASQVSDGLSCRVNDDHSDDVVSEPFRCFAAFSSVLMRFLCSSVIDVVAAASHHSRWMIDLLQRGETEY